VLFYCKLPVVVMKANPDVLGNRVFSLYFQHLTMTGVNVIKKFTAVIYDWAK
jgi:hypothetical protein